MRTFIAIELSDEIKDTLARAQSHLKYAGADVKWAEPGNIHLTLKFLGEITEEKSREVNSALDSVAKDFSPFELSLKDIGAFPNIDYPKIIWVGLDKGAKESALLAARIDEELSRIGFAKESRPFAAHLTIGRVRSGKNKQALKEKMESCQLTVDPAHEAIGGAGSSQKISSLTLFQSKLTPNGPIYTKLHEASLSGSVP